MSQSQDDENVLGRREFVVRTVVATAASTFGLGLAANPAGQTPAPQTPAPSPALAFGNGEPPALQFQAYPGGTGALLEKLARERGRAAFDRAPFVVDRWTGAPPGTDEDIAFLPAHRLSALLKAKRITSARLTNIYLDRLTRLNPVLRCAVTIMAEQARDEALRADAEIKAGKYRGPLHGIPYGLKDVFSTKGAPTTWGAADFESRVIDEDAEVAVRLREAGAVLIAKLATGLFAQGDEWFRGRTNNPWNLSQGSSGSSAGPASATAAGCVAFSIGTETQGSIVSPAIRCGVSALRPTFGRVSRHGGMVLAWSMDRVGPICRTVEDCAMVFSAIHGADDKDPSTVTTPFQFDRAIALASLRVGVDPNAPPELVEALRALGIQPRAIGPRPTAGPVGGLTGPVSGLPVEGAAAFDDYVQRKAREAGLNLAALPGPAGSGRGGGAPAAGAGAPANPMAPADWNPRFVSARTTLALEFVQNQRRRYVLVQRWAAFMKDLDLFIGAPQADTVTTAQTGHPCVVVPYKFEAAAAVAGRAGGPPDPSPLNPQPISAVIVGALFNDDKILSVAHRLQRVTDFHLRRPRL